MYAADTIAAIATPPGFGGIGIIRISGAAALAIAERVVQRRSATATHWRSHRLYHGRLLDQHGQMLDDALAVFMQAPHTYTGEDVVELHCHGSPVVLRSTLQAVLQYGARTAEPGEFTKRAFLNGRLDLVQAEAVADLIHARAERGAAAAAGQLRGTLSRRLEALRAELIGVKALLETQIDFSDEDVSIAPAAVSTAIEHCHASVQSLIDTYRQGVVAREGIRVAIVGKPNVGKSSLLNALLGHERAIVTPYAGTTRDVVEETVCFDGVAVVLADTAGLRDPAAADTVERLGMQRTAHSIEQSDVVIAVLDGSAPMDGDDLSVLDQVRACNRPVVVAINKSDLPAVRQADPEFRAVHVSTLAATGLSALRAAVAVAAARDAATTEGQPIVTRTRHVAALSKALQSLELAAAEQRAGAAPDLVAVDVQSAIDQFNEITGAIASEEVLDAIFREFCIGK